MPMFASSDEVHAYLGGIFEDALSDEQLGPRFAEAGVVLRLNYTDPEATLVVDMPARQVHTGAQVADAPPPQVEMWMTADVGHRFWLGEVNISVALAKRTIRAKGPVPKILKLVPLAQEVFPRYRAQLEAKSRHDLLDV